MALILAIEPDKRQAAQLKVLVKNRLRADLILADTTELALEAIGDRIPDLVLVPALLSPEEDGALNQALRVIAHAAHVQTLTIPVFASGATKAAPAKTGGLLSKLLAGKNEGAPEGCDPAVFGDQIGEYLAEAAANRRGFGDDEFEEEPQAPPASSFARVETFARPDSFQSAVEGFEDELASADAAEPAPASEREAPQRVVREDEEAPRAAASSQPSILREPEPQQPPSPPRERTSVFDSLFKRRERAPVADPAESTWPVYQPHEDTVEEPAAAAGDADNDWAPPADQAIGVDLPPADEEMPRAAAPAPAFVERPDPVEEAVWAEQESDEEEATQQPATKWTPGAGAEPASPRRVTDPAPADLLAEFTADLSATRLRPQQPPPETPRAPSPKTKSPVAARPATQPPQKPKPQPAPKVEPPPAPVEAPPVAARSAPATPKAAPKQAAAPAAKAAPKQAASAVFKPKTERPEWSALIDSLRQDMERMRSERGGRSKSIEPVASPPQVVALRAEPAPEPPPPAATAAPPVAAAAPPDRAVKRPPERPASQVSPATPVSPVREVKRPEKKPTPVQDEWGFFDPQQCGFAALLAKLDEITDNEEKPA
jgi:hypothetical protein